MVKNKKTAKQIAIGIAARAARSVTSETNDVGWPPVCMGIFHQPKRPTNNLNKTTISSNNKINAK
ncbi:MAG: cyclic lactone autoinducer peptide [Anaerocolumna sp.]